MAIKDKLTTRLLTTQQIKQIYFEILRNNTDKITKFTNKSVNNAHGYGVSKLFQRGMKDVAVQESIIFPDTATGSDLDAAADLFGVSDRLATIGSSTFVQIKATVATQYIQGVNIFKSTNGIEFDIVGIHTADANGFAYIPVRSIGTGENTNVEAGTITTITPKPTGHSACTNEYMAVGGRDAEDGETFRLRIKNHPNLIAKETLQYILEVIKEFNTDVLRIFNLGLDDDSKLNIGLATVNGAELTDSELSELEENIKDFLALCDVSSFGNILSFKLINITFHEVGSTAGVDFRVDIISSYDVEDVRKNIQIAMTKYLDFRFWDVNDKVEWDNLLSIVKRTQGVRYVPDEYFLPAVDESITRGQLPRIVSFKMRDLDGTLLFDNSSTTLSVYYTND